MSPTFWKSSRCWAAALGVVVLAGPPCPAQGEKPITPEEFERLHRALQAPKDEAWRGLAWHNAILEARAEAARAKKPIYMLVRSGHPLGCV